MHSLRSIKLKTLNVIASGIQKLWGVELLARLGNSVKLKNASNFLSSLWNALIKIKQIKKFDDHSATP